MSGTMPLKFGLTAVYIPRTPAPRTPYCGAPTKSGGECRNHVAAWGVVCAVHQEDYPW